MPVRVSKSWRSALRAIARIQLSNRFSDWKFMWAAYTRSQRKAVRQMKRLMLSKLEQEAQAEATAMVRQVAHSMLLSGKPTSAASQQLQIAEITAELLQEKLLSKKEQDAGGELEGLPRRPVPVLTPAQEAFHNGITPEAFSLEKAVQMYANRSKK